MASAGHPITDETQIFQLDIRLRDVQPPVWRRVLVPGEMSLAQLHRTIQLTMGWTNSHLHEFEVDDIRYGVPDADTDADAAGLLDEADTMLLLLAQPGTRLGYIYDFGDNWQHDVTVEAVTLAETGRRYPACVAGAEPCPPEDIGGAGRYSEFAAAIDDPDHHAYGYWSRWLGDGWFDPDEFDLIEVNELLGRMRWR